MADTPSITPHVASLPRARIPTAIAARLTAGLDALARIAELEADLAAGLHSGRAMEIGDAQAAHLWSAGIAFGSASDLARRSACPAATSGLADALHAFVLTDCPSELQTQAERLAEEHGSGDCPLGARAADLAARIALLVPDSSARRFEDVAITFSA